ncbi:hypothetical protein [Rhodopirellula sp. P2]|uniref:hypothetical protein n=1 Tax=Rhodopirellula sp. P2 TaxID=2127060 RepID=UPI0023682B9B|nr:hypothetical protein [Rhodopirellula sp. P2]WDQ17383.1 hypothetical protein PSR62_02235 [Rhodopirellula sp. P2]
MLIMRAHAILCLPVIAMSQRFIHKLLFNFAALGWLLAFTSAVGCEQSNAPGPAANEIEQYLQDNPDHVADPDDSMVDESAEFEAGRVSE